MPGNSRRCAPLGTSMIPVSRRASRRRYGTFDTSLAITAAGGRSHQGQPVDFISRYFAPGAGIDEDPVTGSIHSTLVPYWAERLGKTELRAFQASARGGELDCRLVGGRVQLTGSAVTFMRATIYPA